MNDIERLEFLGGPLDGAVRPVLASCPSMALVFGAAVVHVYVRDEVYTGYGSKTVMRHHEVEAYARAER